MDSIEITTNIGCPVACKKYCPQDVLLARYGQTNRMMTLDTFECILANTPKNVGFVFSGFSEPFANPDCIEMIKMAYKAGHPIELFTTFWGVSTEDVEELKAIKFRYFVLHLPDGSYMSAPKTPNYENNVIEIRKSIPNLRTMCMNKGFETLNRENTVKNLTKVKPYSHCIMQRFSSFVSPVVTPDGKVYLCCNDFGLRNYVGNILTENYAIIKERIIKREGEFPECIRCSQNQSYLKYLYKLTRNKIGIIYYEKLKKIL